MLFHCNNICTKAPQYYVISTLLLLFSSWQCYNTLWNSGVCYNDRCYNEWKLQRTIFINKIRMLQWTQMLQRTRRNTIGRCSKRTHMTGRAFTIWLRASFIIFVIVCKVQLSVYFSYLLIFAFSRERLFMVLMCVRLLMLFIRKSLFIAFTKEREFTLFKFTCTLCKR